MFRYGVSSESSQTGGFYSAAAPLSRAKRKIPWSREICPASRHSGARSESEWALYAKINAHTTQ